jgi:hypothetical protein
MNYIAAGDIPTKPGIKLTKKRRKILFKFEKKKPVKRMGRQISIKFSKINKPVDNSQPG